MFLAKISFSKPLGDARFPLFLWKGIWSVCFSHAEVLQGRVMPAETQTHEEHKEDGDTLVRVWRESRENSWPVKNWEYHEAHLWSKPLQASSTLDWRYQSRCRVCSSPHLHNHSHPSNFFYSFFNCLSNALPPKKKILIKSFPTC